MILSQDIIKDIKEKSNLMFDKSADFNALTDEISKEKNHYDRRCPLLRGAAA